DEIGGEGKALAESVRSGIPSAAFGVDFSMKCLIAANLKLPVLYIVKDSLYAMSVAEELSALSGEEAVVLSAKDDVLLYKNSFDKTSLYNRLNALYRVFCGAKYVVATFESLLQLFPSRLPYITVKKGETYDFDELVSKLVAMGYKRAEFAEDKATFAVRGDIFEIYPVNSDKIYRVDFFGDEAESIRRYEPSSGDKEFVDEFTFISATDVIVTDEDKREIKNYLDKSVEKFRKENLKDDARVIARELMEVLSENVSDDRLQFIMPLLKETTDDFLSFMPDDAVVVYDECKMLADNLSWVVKEHTERFLNLSENGKALDFTVKQLADSGKLIQNLSKRRNLAMQNITTAVNFFNPLKTFSVRSSVVARYSAKPESIFTDIENWKFSGYKVLVCCGNLSRAEKFGEALASRGIVAALADNGELLGGTAIVTTYHLPVGFIYHSAKLAVIGTGDLYIGQNKERSIKKKRGDLFQAPEAGDYAVHEVHGIGYVRGVKRITTQEGSKDYVAVEYSGGDVLYVGVDNMDKLTKYVGGEKPALNKIGGREFERIKERVKASIAAMTINLKALYRARKEKKGFRFSPDCSLCEDFDLSFEFEPTEDQIRSEEEIKADMESDKVMDRLLCGDVGFGKTEVAFRAAFKAILDGKQVALVCPTTILCDQHFRNAKERFDKFGLKVAALNRFISDKEQKKVIDGLIAGDIDFVIGTHRLFGKDIAFKDLGLLILDEEQRFGVEHKEKLKLLKENVDTLTMTATPIPRTLHMSLSGIRDISTINTPPKSRIPVTTYVTEESDALIADAVRREMARKGQTLIMYNRVETIYKFADDVRAILPEARIAVAHGQMDKRALENNVLKFYAGEYDVLVATTIIENGIDLPRANTLIVIDSDRLGLSTLYQLKGRVGRSNVLAHAYFTYKKDKVLSDASYKRLSALMEFTEMGSGYKIALRDLEIRGAGNILGREQHGHMDRIGYELYSKLLKESISEEPVPEGVDLDVRIDAFIPESYVASSASRMDIYKQIAEIKGDGDKERIRSSLEENYGKVPVEVDNLIKIAELKLAAARHGCIKIVISEKKAEAVLGKIENLKEEGFLQAVKELAGEATLSLSGEKPVIDFKTEKRKTAYIAEKMRYLFDFDLRRGK
ncbi:MAG: transcription-repair coupling factor, partial [Clostridia bacterium]|nr:transcription-repair coupling factor [Clostridia bacterium]